MTSSPFIMRLMGACVHLSYSAGSVIREICASGNLNIKYKGENDLQTKADLSAQSVIFTGLLHHFPHLKIVGEEEVGASSHIQESDMDLSKLHAGVQGVACPNQWRELNEEDVTVWVDPLDGTSEFTLGLLDHVTVLIGVSFKDRAIAGVIYQPYYGYDQLKEGASTDSLVGRCVWTIVGAGVHGMVPKVLSNYCETNNVIATTRGHGTGLLEDTLKALKATNILRVGGCGHKVLLLLDGLAHSYVFPSAGCKFWDTCAPEAILDEAGGLFRNVFGEAIKYDCKVPKYLVRQGIVATAVADWLPNVVKAVPDSVKKELI